MEGVWCEVILNDHSCMFGWMWGSLSASLVCSRSLWEGSDLVSVEYSSSSEWGEEESENFFCRNSCFQRMRLRLGISVCSEMDLRVAPLRIWIGKGVLCR